MSSTPATTRPIVVDVLAAGAVLWRPAGAAGATEVALVHRPRYDDWSFPKGKLDPGETMPFAAVREIAEETGQRCRLGPTLDDVRYTVREGAKLVRYWAAQALGGTFAPSAEVDELRWLSPEDARTQLTYDHDREVLERFTALGPPASVILFVRHAKAGRREHWHGDDGLRPLTEAGHVQAEQLDALLGLFGPDRIVSAPPLRCHATVAPLARRLGLGVGEEPVLGEHGYWTDPQAGRARLREIAAVPGVTTVCSQGGVIPHVVGALAEEAKLPDVDPEDVPAKKASTWVLAFGKDATLRSADHYPRATGD